MITLNVNGVQRQVDVAGDTPLLYVLRNDLELTGPQFGCGLAQCGACSVLVAGKEVRSCIAAVSDVVGQEIDTRGIARKVGPSKRPLGRGSKEHASSGSAGMDCSADAAMRILPERHDDQSGRAA